jgi:hypothetical protein
MKRHTTNVIDESQPVIKRFGTLGLSTGSDNKTVPVEAFTGTLYLKTKSGHLKGYFVKITG